MHVTVSMPSWNTPPGLLRLAVGDVLRQEHRDLTLVVSNDGGEPLPDLPSDSRLVVVEHPTNRGRYVADAAVLAVAEGAFAVHDADDLTHPEHLARLVAALPEGEGVAVGPYLRLDPGRSVPTHHPVNRDLLDLRGRRWGHVTHWGSGLYSVDRMDRAGGILPAPRVGFDSLHTLLLALTGPVAVVDQPTYTWARRRGSLTSARETGFRSATRERAKRTLMHLHAEAVRADKEGRPVADVVDQRRTPPLREAVANAAERVRRAL